MFTIPWKNINIKKNYPKIAFSQSIYIAVRKITLILYPAKS